MNHDSRFKHGSLALVWFWVALFALLPFCLVITVSFMSHDINELFRLPFTLDNFANIINPIYLRIFEKSFFIAGLSTILCLIIGYPFAYVVARTESRWKNLLMLLVIIPFWTSSLIRSYAIIAIVKAKGIINMLLMSLGIIHEPIPMLFTNTAVIIGLVYNLLPFMILPIMTNIERLDSRIVDAAKDLGATRLYTFRKIIIPLTMPGIISGCILVFLPAMTLFYIPDILGGAKSVLLGNLIQNQFIVSDNWPMGAAFSAILTLVLAGLLGINIWVRRGSKSEEWI